MNNYDIAVIPGDGIEDGAKYVINEIKRQEKFGSNFLDLNVDEMSHKLDIQITAMKWLMEIFEKHATSSFLTHSHESK